MTLAYNRSHWITCEADGGVITEVVVAEKQAYSIKDTAKILSLNPATIRRAIADGEIKVTRVRDSIRIPQKEIDRLLMTGEER
jgi:excisionase family DNA binding protein